MSDLVKKAREYAVTAHARINHFRKYTFQPYDVHLHSVAKMVSAVTDDEAMIAASWLHDAVEDTAATFEDIEREFGEDVMALVRELTDVSKAADGNRAFRKALDRQHLAASSHRAKTIKLADLIDNCEDICRHDPKFGRVYLLEMQALLGVLQEGNSRLFAKATEKMVRNAARLGLTLPVAAAADTEPQQSFTAGHRSPSGGLGIRLFAEAFTARDILEPLVSYDRESLGRFQCGAVQRPNVPVLGVRDDGMVTGYLDLAAAADLSFQTKIRPVDPQQTVSLETSLADVIHILTHFSYCFVTVDTMVVGVIGRRDMEKPVVRMWLFGIIILIELMISENIRTTWPGESWTSHVSGGRLEKARLLKEERERCGYRSELLDCLQLSDKLKIMLKVPGFVEEMGFGSTAAAKKSISDLESLRNNLAHGQDITKYDWPPITRLARRVEQLFGH